MSEFPARNWHDRATDELRIANTLLSDGAIDAEAAALHLARGWELVAAGQGSRDATAAEKMARHLAMFGGGTLLPDVPLKRRAVIRSCQALHQALGREPQRQNVTAVWRRRLLIGIALLGTGLFLLLLQFLTTVEAKWYGRYFSNNSFAGTPVIRLDPDVSFDWSREPAIEGQPKDQFVIRWDTCLEIEEAGAKAFQLIGDDGFRLFVDGVLQIDHWDRLGVGGAELELGAGWHHLRVEFWEKTGKARIELVASLDGAPPSSISAGLLDLPAPATVDGPDPCSRGKRR